MPHFLYKSLLIFTVLSCFTTSYVLAQTSSPSLYWGAYIYGGHYGFGNPPWDSRSLDAFESHAGKKISILHWGQPWHWTSQSGYPGILDGYYQKFFAGDLDKVRNRGIIPLLDWGSWSLGATEPIYYQPTYALNKIINGNFDTYIRQWATDAKNWGHPFFLRFNWEMNGNWYPWSELKNGNQAGQFIQMWRHVHDIFTDVGAANVTWVWCPNISSPDTSISIPLGSLYPGDSYVDWTCLDGYNNNSESLTFEQVFKGKDANPPIHWLNNSYQLIISLAPAKPLMIGETAANEYSSNLKADWITDVLQTQIPAKFPAIKAFLWFNWNADPGSSYVIESTSWSQTAFAAGIATNYYASNQFANLNQTPILPLSGITNPTPTPNLHIGDFNNDGVVDPADYKILLSWYGMISEPGDLYFDGKINSLDSSVWIGL